MAEDWVKMVPLGGYPKELRVYYLKDSTAKTMQHLLGERNINYMSVTKLRGIQNTLYVRS
jgi:hypothetical protein